MLTAHPPPQRIKILELLLTDTRAKNDQLKASIDGGNLGGGGRTVKGAQRPIQGGSGRRAMHNLAQLQVVPPLPTFSPPLSPLGGAVRVRTV